MKFYYENCMCDTGLFSEKNLVKAIYTAWNIEATLYIVYDDCKHKELIFSPHDDNEYNNNLLESYGYKIEDVGDEREIVELKTGNIVKYDWSDVKQLV